MHRTRVKICGVTRVEDAIAAANAGADAVGMIFDEKSARNVDAEIADEIVAMLPPFVTPVAVFVDADPSDIVLRAASHGITTIQLNGKQPMESIHEFFPLRVIRAIHLNEHSHEEFEMWRTAGPTNLIGLVVDTAVPGQAGGTGIPNDWDLLERLLKQSIFPSNVPLIAAGGLNPDNVSDVVRRFRPWAVDVSSGVEASKGIKSVEKIERFCQIVSNT